MWTRSCGETREWRKALRSRHDLFVRFFTPFRRYFFLLKKRPKRSFAFSLYSGARLAPHTRKKHRALHTKGEQRILTTTHDVDERVLRADCRAAHAARASPPSQSAMGLAIHEHSRDDDEKSVVVVVVVHEKVKRNHGCVGECAGRKSGSSRRRSSRSRRRSRSRSRRRRRRRGRVGGERERGCVAVAARRASRADQVEAGGVTSAKRG